MNAGGVGVKRDHRFLFALPNVCTLREGAHIKKMRNYEHSWYNTYFLKHSDKCFYFVILFESAPPLGERTHFWNE